MRIKEVAARTGGAMAAGALLGGAAIAAARSRADRERRRSVRADVLGAAVSADVHRAKVDRIASQLRSRRSTRPISLRKRSVSHRVPKAADSRYTDDRIDVGALDEILSIDPVARLCVAEPGVTFVDLVAATMRHGLVPIIVPELESITLGGAVSGCSIESMSFKYGGFHDTCVDYEVITSSGDVLHCTPDNEHHLVFQMMHGSFGTLGILSRLTFRLVPAKRYVKVTYETHRTIDAYQASIRRHFVEHDVDFMDGIIHSPSELVLSLGTFTDHAPYTHRYDWTRVYYRSTRTRREDYLRTNDYFFRYDMGVTNVFPRTFAGRLLFGKLMDSSRSLRLAETFHRWMTPDRVPFTLDVFVPFSKMPEFLAWYEREFRHFPLWVVPYRRVRDYEWIAPRIFKGLSDELFVDIAIYGMHPSAEKNYHRLMEQKLHELGGLKTLISHNHYPEQEFWETWNKVNYDRAKAVTDPRGLFRDLYAKTCRASMGV
jgi:FAD/FMN-containing dehydrogenase